MDSIVLAVSEAIEASYAPAMVDGNVRNVDTCRFAIACAQVTFLAFLFIDFDTEQREFREKAQHRSYGTNSVAIRPSVPPCQHTYYNKGKHGNKECRQALQPHLGFIESIAVGTLRKISEQVVSPLIDGSKQIVGDSSRLLAILP